MSNRTSVEKAELARLRTVESFYIDLLERFTEYANNEEGIINIASKSHRIDITLNRKDNTVIDWNKVAG